MIIQEIQDFSDIRTKARAYLCYMLSRNIPNKLPSVSLDTVLAALKRTSEEIQVFDSVYILDAQGVQVTNTVSVNEAYARKGAGQNLSNRAYYYRAVQEKRCVLTDPYPSLQDNNLVVTASYPIFDEQGELVYIVCIDITLENILKLVHPTSIDSVFGKISKYVYAVFTFALAGIALLLFLKGIGNIIFYGIHLDAISIKKVFESTILLTLSLAIFDLVKAIFEEEVMGAHRKPGSDDIHQTMVRFLGSIIIALSIEALMLVFKFAITDPEKLLYAVYLTLGISALLISLSFYLRSINVGKSNKDSKR